MEELVQGHVFPPGVLSAATPERSEFGRRGTDNREAVGEISAEGFADKLGAGSVFGLPNLLDLSYHLRRKGDGHGLACSHSESPRITWSYMILPARVQECQE